MKNIKLIGILFFCLNINMGVNADTVDIPSCYAQPSIQFPPKIPDERDALVFKEGKKAIIVMVDETAVLPTEIQLSAIKVNENLFKGLTNNPDRNGVFYQLIKFSSFSEGKFSTTMVRGYLEGGAHIIPKAEDTLPGSKVTKLKTSLKNLNACMSQQAKFGLDKSNQSISVTMKDASSSLPKTEIMTALQEVGKIFANQKEEEKILFLISDMMEHSSYTSFYDKGGDLRDINPESELAMIQKDKILSDLRGVKIWILGGGYFAKPGSSEISKSRNPKKIAQLESFWRGYFQKSNAELIEFGKPALLGQFPQ